VPSNLPKIGRAATARNQTHTAKRCNELECRTRELLTYLDTKLAVEKACRLPSDFWLKKCGPQFLQRPRGRWANTKRASVRLSVGFFYNLLPTPKRNDSNPMKSLNFFFWYDPCTHRFLCNAS